MPRCRHVRRRRLGGVAHDAALSPVHQRQVDRDEVGRADGATAIGERGVAAATARPRPALRPRGRCSLGERLDVVRVRRPGTCRCAAGCARACGSSRCRRCRWPAGRPTRCRRSTPSRSIVPTTGERMAGSATNGVAYGDASAQPYRMRRRAPAARHATTPGPPRPHPLELLVEQEQRGQRRGVVRLVEAAVLEGDRQVERGRDPAARRALIRSIRSTAAGEQERDPQAAVGGEAPSAARSSRRRPRPGSTAGRRRPTWRRPARGRSASAGRSRGIVTPVEVSLWVRA